MKFIERKHRKVLVRFIKKYSLVWYGVTALLYFLAIPFTILVFPATTLILTVLVLFGGFTGALGSFATVLLDAEKDDEMKEMNKGVQGTD